MTDDRPLITGIPAFQINDAETEAELWFKLDDGPPLSVRMTPAAVEEAALRLVQLAVRLGDGNTKYPFGIGSRVAMSIARPVPSTNDVLVSVAISHAGLAPNFYMTSDDALELAQKLMDAARSAQTGDAPIQLRSECPLRANTALMAIMLRSAGSLKTFRSGPGRPTGVQDAGSEAPMANDLKWSWPNVGRRP